MLDNFSHIFSSSNIWYLWLCRCTILPEYPIMPIFLLKYVYWQGAKHSQTCLGARTFISASGKMTFLFLKLAHRIYYRKSISKYSSSISLSTYCFAIIFSHCNTVTSDYCHSPTHATQLNLSWTDHIITLLPTHPKRLMHFQLGLLGNGNGGGVWLWEWNGGFVWKVGIFSIFVMYLG